MTTRNNLYWKAKVLGYSGAYNTSTIASLNKYIADNSVKLVSAPKVGILKNEVLTAETKISPFELIMYKDNLTEAEYLRYSQEVASKCYADFHKSPYLTYSIGPSGNNEWHVLPHRTPLHPFEEIPDIIEVLYREEEEVKNLQSSENVSGTFAGYVNGKYLYREGSVAGISSLNIYTDNVIPKSYNIAARQRNLRRIVEFGFTDEDLARLIFGAGVYGTRDVNKMGKNNVIPTGKFLITPPLQNVIKYTRELLYLRMNIYGFIDLIEQLIAVPAIYNMETFARSNATVSGGGHADAEAGLPVSEDDDVSKFTLNLNNATRAQIFSLVGSRMFYGNMMLYINSWGLGAGGYTYISAVFAVFYKKIEPETQKPERIAKAPIQAENCVLNIIRNYMPSKVKAVYKAFPQLKPENNDGPIYLNHDDLEKIAKKLNMQFVLYSGLGARINEPWVKYGKDDTRLKKMHIKVCENHATLCANSIKVANIIYTDAPIAEKPLDVNVVDFNYDTEKSTLRYFTQLINGKNVMTKFYKPSSFTKNIADDADNYLSHAFDDAQVVFKKFVKHYNISTERKFGNIIKYAENFIGRGKFGDIPNNSIEIDHNRNYTAYEKNKYYKGFPIAGTMRAVIPDLSTNPAFYVLKNAPKTINKGYYAYFGDRLVLTAPVYDYLKSINAEIDVDYVIDAEFQKISLYDFVNNFKVDADNLKLLVNSIVGKLITGGLKEKRKFQCYYGDETEKLQLIHECLKFGYEFRTQGKDADRVLVNIPSHLKLPQFPVKCESWERDIYTGYNEIMKEFEKKKLYDLDFIIPDSVEMGFSVDDYRLNECKFYKNLITDFKYEVISTPNVMEIEIENTAGVFSHIHSFILGYAAVSMLEMWQNITSAGGEISAYNVDAIIFHGKDINSGKRLSVLNWMRETERNYEKARITSLSSFEYVKSEAEAKMAYYQQGLIDAKKYLETLANNDAQPVLQKMLEKNNFAISNEIGDWKISTTIKQHYHKLIIGTDSRAPHDFKRIVKELRPKHISGHIYKKNTVILGAAGTGKSYPFLTKPLNNCAILTPTKYLREGHLKTMGNFYNTSISALWEDELPRKEHDMVITTAHKYFQFPASDESYENLRRLGKLPARCYNIVIDELTMLTEEMWQIVLKRAAGARIIALGDFSQICSAVSGIPITRKFFIDNGFDIVELERTPEMKCRQSYEYGCKLDKLRKLSHDDQVEYVEGNWAMYRETAIMRKMQNNEIVHVVAGTHEEANKWNNLYLEHAKKNQLMMPARLINAKSNVSNFTTIKADSDDLWMGRKSINDKPPKGKKYEPAFAITADAFQGRTCDNIAVSLGSLNRSGTIYTAMTRTTSEEKIYIF